MEMRTMIDHWMRLLLVPLTLIGTIGVAQEEWPVRFESDGINYQVFKPQPESLTGNKFSARAAVSMERPHEKAPVFGAVWGDGTLELDRGSRLARIIEYKVDDARFPGVDDGSELASIRSAITNAIPEIAPVISLDWMVAALEQEGQAGDQYMNDPPEIIYRERPAALVFIDGDPQYEKLSATVTAKGDPLYQPESRMGLERVVNSPFMILRDRSGQHYLYGSRMWFTSRNIDGPWEREQNVPQELQALAADVSESAALTTDDDPAPAELEVIVRTRPSELLALDGSPKMKPIQDTELLTVTNTTRSLFLDIRSQEYYFLASGRWFRTKDLSSGKWTYVPADQLPQEFQNIPEGSDRDMVLAHVAGTDAAREAARDAQIPQTAQVDRRSASVSVSYEGSPVFERITGTNVEYAVNANTDVLRINGHYHVCDNGVWYDGETPDGPWAVSTTVPADVSTIPPSSPVYNVRYVHIYDHTPDVVYMGYTPGYFGSYIQNGVVIYGTGYYYRPWPTFWRPRPWTWGFGMYYDPWYGWGFGSGWGYGWVYPAWTTWGYPYSWGGWWGPTAWYPPCCVSTDHVYYGHRPSVSGRSTAGRSTENGTSRAANTGDLYASLDRQGVRPATISRDRAVPSIQREAVAKPGRADHFTDAAGNVYRQTGDATQRYENGSWSRVTPPKETREGISGATSPEQRPPVQQPRDGTITPRNQQPPETRPTGRDQRPEVSPREPVERDPFQIQRDRQRGAERQQIFQRSERPRVDPSPRSSPRVAPSAPAPRSPAPSSPGRTSGGSSQPSRSSGGQRGR